VVDCGSSSWKIAAFHASVSVLDSTLDGASWFRTTRSFWVPCRAARACSRNGTGHWSASRFSMARLAGSARWPALIAFSDVL